MEDGDTNRGSKTDESQKRKEEANLIGGSITLESSPIQLLVEKLNGKNYREWAQSIKLAVDGKGKLSYLTGETKQPASTDVAAHTKWRPENSMVTWWLVSSMKPTIGRTYMFLQTPKYVWDAVKETYSDVENSSQIFEIKTRLWQMKQGERDATDFYMEMTQLWQELDLNTEEEWECPADSVRFKKRLENERVFEFLAGLNRDLRELEAPSSLPIKLVDKQQTCSLKHYRTTV